jgi:hypothetical protein
MTMTTATQIPDTDTVVTVQNIGTRALHCYCGPDKPALVFEPGQSRRVPAPWARTWFGDERSREAAYHLEVDGEKIVIQSRPYELERLKHLWGAATDPLRWEPANDVYTRPEAMVTTLDGDRVLMVLDDPEGNSVNPATQSVDDARLLKDELVRLQKRLMKLEGLQAAGVEEIPTLTEGDLPKDNPGRPGRGKP